MSTKFVSIIVGLILAVMILYPLFAPVHEISGTPGGMTIFQYTDAGRLTVKAKKARKQGDLDAAERYLRQSIAITPWADTQQALAEVLALKGDGRKALEYYRAVVHPDLSKSGSTLREQPDVLLKYAQLCDKFGEKEEAEEAYRKIIGLHKTYRNLPSFSDGETNPKRLRAQALTVTGVYYTQKARDFNDQEARKDALAAFDEAIRLEPNGSAATYRQKVLTQKPKAAQ